MDAEDTVYARFRKQVEAGPDRLALTDGSRRFTYAQLDSLVGAVSAWMGPMPSFAGIVMDHGAEMVAAILAVLKAGSAYVPAEPTFPLDRIRYMMGECGAVITDDAHADDLAGLPVRVMPEHLDFEAATERSSVAYASDTAYVLYTSGTTGAPKGIAVSNANVCHYARAFENEFHIGPSDAMLQYSVCTFDIFVEEVFASLLNGAALAVPTHEERGDVERLMDFVRRNDVTIVSGFPYLLSDLNQLDEVPECIRLFISGGDVLRARHVDRLLGCADVYNTYGPTETTVCATYFKCNGSDPLPDATYPVGKPVAGVSVEVQDDDGNPVALGDVGEICIGGGGVSKGYRGDIDQSAFFEADAGRMYRSGDMGRWLPDGNLVFLHRKDDQVMIDGRRTEPQEVQTVLANCRGVKECLVRARVDEDQMPYLTAYVVPQTRPFLLSSARRHMAERLPAFMIPEFFVILDEIPQTPNGKPDDAALPIVLKER